MRARNRSKNFYSGSQCLASITHLKEGEASDLVFFETSLPVIGLHLFSEV
jgi:hypothetical protein